MRLFDTQPTIHDYYEWLTYQRRARSAGEAEFLERYFKGVPQDDFGNFRVQVGDTSRTLFSCHVDSVHPKDGIRQRISVDLQRQEVFKSDKYALGADCASGIFIMVSMIHAGIPGTYVFHRDEEVGGLGSSWIAKEDAAFLEQFDHAIAFDRRGVGDVITHQGGARCCSDTFAIALAAGLGMGYRPDDSGLFTDTANYDHVIPECTNISVGYENEHSGHETQDVRHLLELRETVLSLDWAGLPVSRDPTYYEPVSTAPWWQKQSYWTSNDDFVVDDHLDEYHPEDLMFTSPEEAWEFLNDDPDSAAMLLWKAYRLLQAEKAR